MPSFIFDISSSVFNTGSPVYPVQNTANSFSGFSQNYVVNGALTTVTVTWTSFTSNADIDGLSFTHQFSDVYPDSKSVNITQFGGIVLINNGAFRNFNGKITATDVPTILNRGMDGLSSCFYNSKCSQFGNIGNWDVSSITTLASMFSQASNFNQDISAWNVSNVSEMSNMFNGCTNFNQPLNNWNVSNVISTSYMFELCTNFNQPLNNWNVSIVYNMYSMFKQCTNFNQPLNNWNVANVTNMDSMFFGCSNFNQPLNNWNVSIVTNMYQMFMNTSKFNGSISNWNTGLVTNMSYMFRMPQGGSTFNQYVNNWNVSNVTNMNNMFSGCIVFNQPLNNWNVSKVTNMNSMFQDCSIFNQYIYFNFKIGSSINNMIRYAGYNAARMSAVLTILNTNSTFTSKNIGIIPSYLNNSQTAAVYTTLTTTKSNTISDPSPITPVPSTFKSSGYLAADLKVIGYTATELRGVGYTYDDLKAGGFTDGEINWSCFKEDTNILCYKDGTEFYKKIQDLRLGDLVKTGMDGYVPVHIIGTTKIYNSGNDIRGKNRLYKCTKSNYPEITEDLIMTGCHSILVDELTEKQRDQTMEFVNDIFITDNKYRLMACIDDRAIPYDVEGVFNIWHLALENDNYYWNYGIYANGLLVETTSIRYLKELSGMTLIV